MRIFQSTKRLIFRLKSRLHSFLRRKVRRHEVVGFGYAEEWRDFVERHSEFLNRFPNLKAALDIAFIRTVKSKEPTDRVIFFLGRICVEDFMEILLLSGNGYGIGAEKILRGMYERAVTARYLHKHPDETERFLDFHWIQQSKLAKAVQSTLGAETLPPEIVRNVEYNYARVKSDFIVEVCHSCGRKDVNYTWSRMDLVSMAAEGSLKDLVVPAYYLPLREAHSTTGSILSRMNSETLDRLEFHEGAQRDRADQALITAHNLLLNILDLQHEHFHLEQLDVPRERCFQDFIEIWDRKRSSE